jgi:hypothetical protein
MASFILLYLLMVAGAVLFLMIWTVRRARQRGTVQTVKAIGIWAGAVLLVTLAAVAWTMMTGRSPVSASAEQLTGYWTSKSSEGTAAIDLRSNGSAFVEGVPSAATFEVGWAGDDLGLPPMLSGEGTWEVGSNVRVALTCANGQTVTLLSDAVQSSTGEVYLQFMAGDPDAPTFFREFSRIDSDTVPDPEPGSGLAC